jgi:DNA-binding NarL/FixJ family response regulator
MPISILLVDDHSIFRKGVRLFLEARTDFQITGEASTGAEALVLAGEQRPNVIILDWVMPGLSGLDVLRKVSHSQPETRVVILSMHSDEAYVTSALENGALGYVLKDDIVVHLAKAVQAAAAGAYYLSPSLMEGASIE